MAMIEQIGAYEDCTLIWQRAVDTPGGIRVPVGTESQANILQMRMNKCRSIHRRMSMQIHPQGSPKYNTSEFDTHMVQVRYDTEGMYWIYVRPHGRLGLLQLIEPISDTEPEVLEEHHAAEQERAIREVKPLGAIRYDHTTIPSEPADGGDPDGDLE